MGGADTLGPTVETGANTEAARVLPAYEHTPRNPVGEPRCTLKR